MKYFIVGLHGSGKREILGILKDLGVRCGKLFSDIDVPEKKFYGSLDYEIFPTKDINEIFENNAYVFIQRINLYGKCFYEGLSQYEFDNNDVFVLSPDQLSASTMSILQEPYCFIWIDNTKLNRYNRFIDEKREYNFMQREEQESQDLSYFVSLIYEGNNPVLYFNNEDPQRIATIVYSLIKHPDLLEVYKKSFNN